MSSPQTEFVNTIIKAGAGAGKTYGLIHKIVDLVKEYSQQNGGQLPRFVVTTFTRKATQEVRERLLAKALELRKTDPEFGQLFLKFLKSSGFLLISTIHGVLNQFLRQHGNHIGLDPDFKVSKNSEKLFTELLHQLLLEEPLMEELVSKFGWRRIRIFFTEHHRNYLLNPEISPAPEELVTKHWQGEIEKLSSASYELESYLQPLLLKSKSVPLRNFAQALGEIQTLLTKNDSLWEQLRGLKELLELFPTHMGSLSQWDPLAKELRKQVLQILNEIAEDPLSNLDQLRVHQKDELKLSEMARRFSQIWLKRKIEQAEIEMDDLELLSIYILRNFPEQTRAFSDSWNYWFIDEYQDTSPVQVEILNLLIGERQHYVVGDPQQSIYFFRGARSKVFNEKFNAFSATDARTEVKKINRRSTPPTLCFINDLMDLVNKQQFSPMEPVAKNHSDPLLVGHFCLTSEDDPTHLQNVVRTLQNLLTQESNPSEIAVLCRENAEIYSIFEALQAAGLPAQISSQGRFLDDEIIQDALALWRFLVVPFDNANLIQVLRTPWFRLNDQELFQACQQATGTLWETLREFDHPSVQKLNDGIKKSVSLGHVETWTQMLMDSSAITNCTQLDPSGRKEGNLWKLINNIHEQNRTGTLNLADPLDLALETNANNENEARSIRASKQIQLMTIHGSKGLEFNQVVIPFLNHKRKKESPEFWSVDLENQYFSTPFLDLDLRTTQTSFYAKSIAAQITDLLAEESERLFYVAITRAKKGLYFFPPATDQELSPTGWARHLQSFLTKGLGHFRSDSGQYEFAVLQGSDLKAADYNEESPVQIVADVPALIWPESVPVETLAATALIRSSNEEPLVKAPQLPWDTERIERGISIHREFESYTSTKGRAVISEDLALFMEKASIPLLEIIKNGFPEWPFRIHFRNKIVDGQIDLWGKDQQGVVWIIDYKTGSSRFADKAFTQLEIYAWALFQAGQITETSPVNLAICYPLEMKTKQKTLLYSDLQQIRALND